MNITPQKLLVGVVIGILVPTVGVVGLALWKKKENTKRASSFVAAVSEVRENLGAEQALHLLVRQRPPEIPEVVQVEVDELRRELIAESSDVVQLNALMRTDPDILKKDEKLALLKCRQYLSDGDSEKVEKLLREWEPKADQKEDWFFISLAKESANKNPDETLKLLEQAKKSGVKSEQTLLHRAVFAAAKESDDAAWKLLLEAYRNDPKNWELRMFMGNFLEKKRNLQAAQREYVAALLIDPANILARDRLANFYLRYGRIGSAIQTWRDAPDGKLPAFMWARLNYWSRLYHDVEMPALKLSGLSSGYAQVLKEVPDNRFWSEKAEAASGGVPAITEHVNQMFWLRTIDLIQSGQEKEAADHLLIAPSLAQTEQSHLLASLRFILRLRLSKDESIPFDASVPETRAVHHDFFRKLDDWKESRNDQEFVRFCQGKDAYAAAFMAAGWTRVAGALVEQKRVESPSWFRFGIAKCLWHCEGTKKAVSWLDKQKLDFPELVLLRAELDLAGDKIQEGIVRLTSIQSSNTDAGERAALLLALRHMEANEFDEAEKVRQEQPRFLESQQGAELGARIAIRRGDIDVAREFFEPWRETSLEGRLFFAKEAFDSGDFSKAKEITKGLVVEMPLNVQLQRNLKSIEAAEVAQLEKGDG